jgi:pimeloyl-ACP methyl ester carboxylesterase
MQLSNHHPFRSADTKQAYLAHYDRRAKDWPVALETRLVITHVGQTFVRLSGPVDAPPLVLLPGSVLNSLMWLPNIKILSNHYRTYAVDNILDCGRSIYTQPIKTIDDLVNWLDELFDALELDDHINLMGLSYGGWLTSQYAFRHPQRLAKIVLLAPAAIQPMQAAFITRFFLSFIAQRYFKKFIYWMFADLARKNETGRQQVQAILEDMLIASRSFKPVAMILPKALLDSELQALKVPTLILLGENEKTYPARKAIDHLNKIAPHIQTELIPQAGHDLSFVQANLVTNKVIEFLKQA